MDPRHPNIAFAANTGALLAFLFLLFSVFLPFGTPRGWALPETVLLIIIPLFLGLSWWAKRDHIVPVVHAHGSSAAQYEAMEDLPTMVNLDDTNSEANSNTVAVIESIIGSQTVQDSSTISNAIGTLSSRGIGKSSEAVANPNPVQKPEIVKPNFDSRGFQTEGIASVPLPSQASLELPDVPVMADLPAMSDLDDLLTEDEYTAVPPPLNLPDVPDF